ncbi:hypothetical protein LJ739_12580 [Aestuariibacter halophilus]|uniref:Tetratricopeptide repeat protein n=1 Tax=Fluctibacter halophilus TaxID=226011 RepID=A0ABS8G954_9ALTE|nr:hypothetical protein [Aestuariibacter halophilus]MCC2617080.1 hypothetical protein [Aestuariibacter halophilus]
MKLIKLLPLLAAMVCFHTLAETAISQAPLDVQGIQTRWAEVNYTLEEDAQEDAFLVLIEQAEHYTNSHPDDAAGWIWLGITQSSTAGAVGGLGALKYAKAARKSLEHALKIDPNALSGSAMTSLGVLYHKVPGWPIGFGSDKKARQLLTEALKVNPEGIDPNYFFAEFLYDEREYEDAKKYLTIAKQAPARPLRPLADSGRHTEIDTLMAKINAKL